MPSKNSVRTQSGRNLIVALTTTFKGEPYEMDIARIIAHLTLSQKIALVEGHDSWHTFAVPENGIRALTLTDGPHGLRMARQAQGGFDVDDNEESTAFPTSATVGSSWNPAHAYAIGRAIAQECVERGVDVLLAPGINITRNPLCGRNFEYYSEDPLLSGAFGSQFVQGVQSRGGGGCAVKHFAANSNENRRFAGAPGTFSRAGTGAASARPRSGTIPPEPRSIPSSHRSGCRCMTPPNLNGSAPRSSPSATCENARLTRPASSRSAYRG